MANREELAIIRNARAGQASAQLALGRLYLFGSTGLPRSLPTALHWLERAAHQDCPQAWQLIGDHIPFDLAQHSAATLAQWYERAYDDGSVHAGLVFAQLVFDPTGAAPGPRPKAVRALEEAVDAGFPDAAWLLAQQGRQPERTPRAAPAVHSRSPIPALACAGRPVAPHPQAPAVVCDVATLDGAWSAARWDDYLAGALPLARMVVRASGGQADGPRLAPDDITLLSRCARLLDPALEGSGECGAACVAGAHRLERGEPAVFWELAAAERDRYAALALGLRCARMHIDGHRRLDASAAPVANFRKAIRWLALAGEQGLAEAWFALSRIYGKPEFSQRNVIDAQRYLERAADMGYRAAQLECGHHAWRARRENENNDVRAVYWLRKAAAQGASEAGALLRKIAPRAATPAWPETGRLLARHGALLATQPLLAARIELAALFALSRPEALLLDVGMADQGHCLVIDIRASYGRSKRRLVLVETAQQRQSLDRIVRLFEAIDCGPTGPEGNYRQRLYRLRALLDAAADADGGEDKCEEDRIGLAA